jgi:hypothetical protein
MNDITRRRFVGSTLGGVAVAIIPLAARAAPHVAEDDETAVALGYRHDTRQVDAAKFPKHKPEQRCVNCSLFQGAATDEWGGCAMFGRKHVAAAGWCNVWAKMPG